jgi:hypothetical protein
MKPDFIVHIKGYKWVCTFRDIKIEYGDRIITLDEIDRLEAENSRLKEDVDSLRSRLEAVAGSLVDMADGYERDGEPGPLSGGVWGWRTIAEHLRSAAKRVAR